MFVRNRTKVPFKVCVGAKKIILEPNTVTHVEDGLITEKRLRDIYGHRIDIIKEDGSSTAPSKVVAERPEVKLEKRTENLTDATLESILKEVVDDLEVDKYTNYDMTEQEMQEALEDIQEIKKQVIEGDDKATNDEDSDVIAAPTSIVTEVDTVADLTVPTVDAVVNTPTVPEAPATPEVVNETLVKTTKTKRATSKARAKRVSKKKQN